MLLGAREKIIAMKNNGARSKSSLNWNLFLWCASVFALTAVLLVIAWWLWGIVGDLKTEPVGRATSALTTVGGLGGAVFLTVKYRAHSLAERQEDRDIEAAHRDADANGRAKEIYKAQLLTQRRQALVDATSLLGSDVAATRIAGITVLAEIADTYKGNYRQQVVDILCGYLRTTHKDDERGHDNAVESTILNILASHLRKQRAGKNGNSVTQTFGDDPQRC